jgi:predicted nucleotidyltransferase
MKTPETSLEQLKDKVQEIYGPRFRRMILYGSYARGEAQEGSDVDILLVLKNVSDPLAERERLSDVLWQLALEHTIVLSVLPVDEHAFETRQTPLFLNVKREGVTL